MKSARRDNRVAAVQFLYMWESNPSDNLPLALERFFSNVPREEPDEGATAADTEEKPTTVPTMEAPPHKRDYYAFAEELVNGVVEHLAPVDDVIKQYTKNWDFKRIARIDLAILRLAIYEMMYRKDIPPIVSINEAIDLSKTFSIGESRRFINGILDQFKLKLDRPLRESSV